VSNPMDHRIIAVIPARGGSKRIPSKNLVLVDGRPLIDHTLRHARLSAHIDATYVSTDDTAIAERAAAGGAIAVKRPSGLSGDLATSEAAILHVLDWRRERGLIDPSVVVFLQCTSPARYTTDIDRAVECFFESGADTLFSGFKDANYVWGMRDGELQALTYDLADRRRGQEFESQFRENGSIFVFRASFLRETGRRLGGRIAVFEMDFWTSFEINVDEDVELLDWVLQRPGLRFADGLESAESGMASDE
jgi:CMP-N,N'-diacetyllegionaminic acid synthase